MQPPNNYTLLQKIFWLHLNQDRLKRLNAEEQKQFNKKTQS